MFKELLPLLEGRTMILTAAKIGDALTVTIYPKRNGEKDENPVGNTPLCVTGTPEELDHELPGLIAGYAEELGKFHTNLGQIKQQLANAATAAAEAAKVKTARKPATAPAKPAAKSAEPAEPPVARPDLFTTSMPPAAAAPEPEPTQADAADGTAAIGTDPKVVQPPAPSAAATQPRKRATPIRGKAVETPLCQALRPRPFRRLRGVRLAWRRRKPTLSRSRLPRSTPPSRCKPPRRKWDGAMKTIPRPSRQPWMTPATTTMIRARSDHEEDRWFPVGTFLPLWAHEGDEAITPPAIMHASECAANPTWADTPVNAGRTHLARAPSAKVRSEEH